MKLRPPCILRSGVRRERRPGGSTARAPRSNMDGHKEAQNRTKRMNLFSWFFVPFCGQIPGATGPRFLRVSLRPARKEWPA